MEWISAFKKPPHKVFLVHGEDDAKKALAESIRSSLGYDCIVVEDVSEYDLDGDVRISIQDIKNLVATEEQLYTTKDKLAQIHDELETILYNTNLVIDEDISLQRFIEISNIVLELEKSSLRLGSIVAKEEV